LPLATSIGRRRDADPAARRRSMSGTFGTDRLGLAQRRKVLQRQGCAECLNRSGHGQVGQRQPARAQTDRWSPVVASSGYRRPRQTHERQLLPPIELRFRP